jgi:hypothetical protein
VGPPTLFDGLPPGFVYQPEFITPDEENALLDRIGAMEFSSRTSSDRSGQKPQRS